VLATPAALFEAPPTRAERIAGVLRKRVADIAIGSMAMQTLLFQLKSLKLSRPKVIGAAVQKVG
jgi:hypothetical protein